MATYNDLTVLYSSSLTTYNAAPPTVTRTATGEGTGSSAVVYLVTWLRSASGAGTGTSSTTSVVIRIQTATGSGTGTSTTTGLHVAPRTATGSGTGTSTTTSIRVSIRTATDNGTGTSTTVGLHIAPRTATGSGTGTSTSVGAKIVVRIATGSGTGTESDGGWVKSHIFRVPTTSTYPFAQRLGTSGADRLFSFVPQGIRQYNLFKLDDSTYQITDPRMPERIIKVYYGGHDNFLDDTEVAELTAAGYGASIT